MRFSAVFGMSPEICFAFDSETVKTPKNSTLFSAVSALDTIGGGGGKIENGVGFSSKQPPSNKKSKESEGKIMRKKSTRLLSAALAACMMLSVLPVGAFAAEPGTEQENAVTAQEEAQTLPKTGGSITSGGTYTMDGGEYTGPITVNVQDGNDVIINITGHVTTSIKDVLIEVVNGQVKINGDGATVENIREGLGSYHGIGSALIALSSTDNNTTVEINGGTYSNKFGVAVGCQPDSNGTLTIKSGTFKTGMGGAVVNDATVGFAVMRIEGGTFIGFDRGKDNYRPGAYALENYGTTIIEDGLFQSDAGVVVDQSKGELQIDGGTFESMNGDTVIDIESGPSKTTINNGDFKNVQGCGSGNVVYCQSYMGDMEENTLFITGGTFEIKGEDVDGIWLSYTRGTVTVENATIKVNASGKGTGIVRTVDAEDELALKVKNVTIENAGASRDFSDILLYNYRTGPVDLEITEDFTNKAVVGTFQTVDGLQVTTKTATHYQKDLKLVSADPKYIIDYKNDDGTEYRYFNKRETGKYYVNPINATMMTADDEEKRPYSQFAQGDKVTLTAFSNKDGEKFTGWKVEKIAADGVTEVQDLHDVLVPNLENPETATLTVPNYDVFVTAEYKDEGEIVDPGTGDTDYGGDIAAGVVIGGIAAVGAYEVGTGLYRILAMDDVAMPTNRIALAKLLWERAGKPEPESTALYSDISAEDTDAQKAARWAVEQGLMKDDTEQDDQKFHPAFPVSKLRVCLTWNAAREMGLFDKTEE